MDNEEKFIATLKDNLSPQAMAVMSAHLQSVSDKYEPNAVKEVFWFSRMLDTAVGGVPAMNGLYDEVGV